ncbi:hypothetical protein RJ641_034058 [Dillenia turbinata]|uniref:E3 ubiquitin protein ligase n=1 Tax=Dillenia turbinata TaxID=194707 RepID=A0AAN8VL28_9MAGN
MENSESEEPEKKRPHLLNTNTNTNMARNSTTSPDHRPVDAAVLQYQNQQLVQLLDTQRQELHDLEDKIKELQHKQMSYDHMLISVNQLWNELVDDLALLGIQAGGGPAALQFLDRADHIRGSIPSCPAEEIFLCRLLEVDSLGCSGSDKILKFVEDALALRCSSTKDLMKFLEDTINDQRAKAESVAQVLKGMLSAEDALIQLTKIHDLIEEETKNLQGGIDQLHLKHKKYADEIQNYIKNHSVDQSEIKRLSGELEESMAELEESRRKLVNLKMQKNVAYWIHSPGPATANGNLSPEKHADKAKGLKELKDSMEETKNELNDEKYVRSSRPYTLLNDQLQHWTAEAERYKMLTDSLQADRSYVMRREKEISGKADSSDVVKNAIHNAQSKIEELGVQLQNCIIEKNDLEIKMEEAVQDSGRKDIKAEFHVMASALSKEMGMMEAQLNRWKDTAHEALSLREEAESMKALLSAKINEHKSIADKCAEQIVEIKSLKTLIEKMQKEKMELQIFLDMHGQEIYDNRDVGEIKESERRALMQAEVLRNALDEHSLELRVKAANEAEAACQQRLSAAEAEIADLRNKVDASERDVLELKEAIRIKDAEAEAYISEIETIGQAYEDMQTQNQHLLQQVAERDEYNIKLVSESVKTKQAQNFLVSEKQALTRQLQQVNMSLESLKLRIFQSEEQMKVCLTEALKFTQENGHLAINLEKAKWELADAEKELKWLKSAYASSEKDNEQIQRNIDDIQMELDTESEAAIQKLQDEIKDCKAILKCGVCFDRPKEVVITKCYHLFCNPCIQRNLEIRHRKCPGCGTAFGQSDVRFVKI